MNEVEILTGGAKLITITPDDANFYLRHCRFPLQRPINEKWVAQLVERITNGKLIPAPVDFAIDCEKDITYLVNGYHRLNAVVIADRPIQAFINVHHCPNYHEVQRTYTGLDVGKVRTLGDAIRAMDIGEEFGLNYHEIPYAIAATCMIETEWVISRYRRLMDKETRIDIARQWIPEMQRYAALTREVERRPRLKTLNSAFASIAYVTMRHNDDAEVFWRAVLQSSGEKDSPEKHLSYAIFWGTRDTRSMDVKLARTAAYLWGKYVKQTRLIRYYLPDGEISIAKTPYKIVAF